MTRTAPDAPAAGANSATHAAAVAGTTSIPTATLGDATMQAFFMSGSSRAELREVPIPQPDRGQVLLRARASTICGSDFRAAYREHLRLRARGLPGHRRRTRALRHSEGYAFLRGHFACVNAVARHLVRSE